MQPNNSSIMNPYEELVSFILPKEIHNSFEVKKTEVKIEKSEPVMYIYLDEYDKPPKADVELFPNGFYEPSMITDFPIRDHKVVLVVRRRRWKDADGKSYSNDNNLVAKGTRFSNEFAAFLKELYR